MSQAKSYIACPLTPFKANNEENTTAATTVTG